MLNPNSTAAKAKREADRYLYPNKLVPVRFGLCSRNLIVCDGCFYIYDKTIGLIFEEE